MNVAILGGGISGLSAAHAWLRARPDARVTLFEATTRLGGWIETTHINDFCFERGPRTFQAARSPCLLRLIEELGLKGEIVYSEPTASARFLWHGGKLRSIASFWPTIAGALVRDLVAPRARNNDESLEAFGNRRFGKRATALFVDAMATGVFAGETSQLSVRDAFPGLWEWEQKHGSCVLGMLRVPKRQAKGLFSLRGGLQTLVDAFPQLPIDVRLQTPVEELRADGVVAGGAFFPADVVIAALPAREIAQLVGAPLDIPHASLSVVNLGYHSDVLPHKGYGYLVPTQEREKLLGMIWDSALFSVHGQTKVTAMVRSDEPVNVALEAMQRHLGVRQAPAATLVRHAEIPQYTLGHAERVATFERAAREKFPRLRLLGNWCGGASVDQLVRLSQQEALGPHNRIG